MRCGYLHVRSLESSLSICSGLRDKGLREECASAWREKGRGAEAEVGEALKMLARRSGCIGGDGGFDWESSEADGFSRGEEDDDDECKKPVLVVGMAVGRAVGVSIEVAGILKS